MPDEPAGSSAPADGPVVTWRSHPFAERPRVSAVIAIGLAVSWWFGWHLLGVFGLALAVFGTASALGPYLFPTVYTVAPDGASARTLWQTRHFTWGELGGYDIYPDAVQLVLDSTSLRSRIQKGLLLPFAQCDREALLSALERYLPTDDQP